MAKYFLGVDGGQTSTTALIADETGTVLGFGRGGPSNHVKAEEGPKRFRTAMSECLGKASQEAGINLTEVQFESAALGFSGGPRNREDLLKDVLRAVHLSVSSDLDIALAGALAGEPGIVVIGGTGSAAFGKNAAGRAARAGGWGSLFGDEGSAFDLVRKALRAALRQEEQSGPPTVLHDKLLQAVGIGHVHDLVRKFYDAEFPVARVAGFAPLIDQAAEEGDAVAAKILEECADELAELLQTVRNRLFATGERVRASYIGGVFRSKTIFRRYCLLAGRANCEVLAPAHGPAAGALLEAYRLVGLRVTLSGLPEAEK